MLLSLILSVKNENMGKISMLLFLIWSVKNENMCMVTGPSLAIKL